MCRSPLDTTNARKRLSLPASLEGNNMALVMSCVTTVLGRL